MRGKEQNKSEKKEVGRENFLDEVIKERLSEEMTFARRPTVEGREF